MGDDPQLSVFFIAMAVILGAAILSRFIREAGLKHLSSEQKVALVDAFSGQRKYSLLIVVAIAAIAYFVYPLLVPVALVAYMIVGATLTIRKLRALNVPASFLRNHIAASAVLFIGLVGAFSAMAWRGGL